MLTGLVCVVQLSHLLKSIKKRKFAYVLEACSKKYYNLDKSLLIKSCYLRCELSLQKNYNLDKSLLSKSCYFTEVSNEKGSLVWSV
jgi:hypothetical protein